MPEPNARDRRSLMAVGLVIVAALAIGLAVIFVWDRGSLDPTAADRPPGAAVPGDGG